MRIGIVVEQRGEPMAEITVPINVNLPDDWIEQIVKRLRNDPDSEWVEVTRCKDCKNWDTTWQNDWAKNYHYCPLIDGTRNGDWYCADAERREDV